MFGLFASPLFNVDIRLICQYLLPVVFDNVVFAFLTVYSHNFFSFSKNIKTIVTMMIIIIIKIIIIIITTIIIVHTFNLGPLWASHHYLLSHIL